MRLQVLVRYDMTWYGMVWWYGRVWVAFVRKRATTLLGVKRSTLIVKKYGDYGNGYCVIGGAIFYNMVSE